MGAIQVLDCTLRDGGYCNEWKFGNENIKKILKNLTNANIDIIECGYLTRKGTFTDAFTKYNTVTDIEHLLPLSSAKSQYICMINFGEYDANNLPDCEQSRMKGIRLAFHKKDKDRAIEQCNIIKEKGYNLFIQPMVSLEYTDLEFLELMERCNQITPYAFYMVDSFGSMTKKDITRLFHLLEHNLKKEINIGYHSHNNMQLAYSNAQLLMEQQTRRGLIIDSSVLGMGRAAGNLNTELLVGYMNENRAFSYNLPPLLTIIDEVIEGIYESKDWRYLETYYLSAVYQVHPNYGTYLKERGMLTIADMNEIFFSISEEKRSHYTKENAEEIYMEYLEKIKK